MSYAKLFSTLTSSSIWAEPHHVRICWITMLAMANRYGAVEASVLGLAHMARITVAECEASLQCFLSPDPYSRTKDHDGRRIEEIPGGWRLLNYEQHRSREAEDAKRERQRNWIRDKRARLQEDAEMSTQKVDKTTVVDAKVDSRRQAEAEAEAVNQKQHPSDVSSASPDEQPALPGLELEPEQPPIPVDALVALYNSRCGALLPKCEKVRKSTSVCIKARWSEPRLRERMSLEWWGRFFDRVLKSQLLTGQVPSRGQKPWRADLHWLVKENNFWKVIEGNYT